MPGVWMEGVSLRMKRMTKERINLLEFHRDRAFRDTERLTGRIAELEAQVEALNARILALEARSPSYVPPEYPIPGVAYPLWSRTTEEPTYTISDFSYTSHNQQISYPKDKPCD